MKHSLKYLLFVVVLLIANACKEESETAIFIELKNFNKDIKDYMEGNLFLIKYKKVDGRWMFEQDKKEMFEKYGKLFISSDSIPNYKLKSGTEKIIVELNGDWKNENTFFSITRFYYNDNIWNLHSKKMMMQDRDRENDFISPNHQDVDELGEQIISAIQKQEK